MRSERKESAKLVEFSNFFANFQATDANFQADINTARLSTECVSYLQRRLGALTPHHVLGIGELLQDKHSKKEFNKLIASKLRSGEMDIKAFKFE